MDTRSLVKLTIGGAIVLGGLAFPPFLAGDGIVWGTMLATALASVAAGNTANAIDALTQGKDCDRISLENEDLTKAVGKAIAAVITLAAKQHPRDTRRKLEKIAAQAKDNWVKIAQQELTQQRYPQLREAKLDEFLTPEEYSLTQNGNLTPQEWRDIFIRLNMAACKGGGFQLPPKVYPQVADLLHTTFPKALRETLKEDFEKDGKAFAGLTLQLLTGMKAELAQLRNSNLAVNTAELTQILQQFQQLETQLRGTVAQQQAFFRQISQQIDSGFAEVCQQLGVMETTITGLLQNLEESLERLRQDVAEVRQEMRQGFEEIRTQQGGRQLSRQELKARQKLLSEVETEVESRLAQSLHHAVPLNLGKEQQPHQVQRPWDVSVKVGEQRSFKLPSETSILEVFENPAINGKFLILGKPGGGKTTTLLELAQALVERAETDSDAPIPVILELSAWQTVTKRKFPDFWNKEKYDPSIKEWILSQLRSKGISQEIGEQWIKEKELVLLLDGLDELPSERQAKCVRAINQFLDSEFSPLHLVVCSRKEEYEEYEEVLHLNGAICLEDLTVEQMRHYFASVNLGEFWESIKDSEKIINFIRQPLFLAITSIAYQQIDIEGWRNCNMIDYLLGAYIDRMLKYVPRVNIKKGSTEYFQTLNVLILLSKTMRENKLNDLTTAIMGLDFFISYFLASLSWKSSSFYIHVINYAFVISLLTCLVIILYWMGIVIFIPIMLFFVSYVVLVILIKIISQKSNYSINEILTTSLVIFMLCYGVVDALDKMGISINLRTVLSQDIHTIFSGIIESTALVFIYMFVALMFYLFNLYLFNENTRFNRQDLMGTFRCIVIGLLCLSLLSLIIKDLTFLGSFLGLSALYLIFVVLQSSYNLFRHFSLRLTLWLTGQMPLNITRFLDYCTERLILQRVGNRYRFIHRLVQEHFANLKIQKE